jgi:hypothetical protein
VIASAFQEVRSVADVDAVLAHVDGAGRERRLDVEPETRAEAAGRFVEKTQDASAFRVLQRDRQRVVVRTERRPHD